MGGMGLTRRRTWVGLVALDPPPLGSHWSGMGSRYPAAVHPEIAAPTVWGSIHEGRKWRNQATWTRPWWRAAHSLMATRRTRRAATWDARGSLWTAARTTGVGSGVRGVQSRVSCKARVTTSPRIVHRDTAAGSRPSRTDRRRGRPGRPGWWTRATRT